MAAVMKTSGLAGLLTGAVALGVAELTAAVTGPNGAPVTAVGETAINLTPVPVKEFAIAHRRAVDRVRSENACSRREQKAAEPQPAEDDVAETVAATLERQRVRRCMDGLTGLQRESIKLAYYNGYSYPEVAKLLGVALGTVKTRIRDGLIRMRDCMEVTW